MVCSDWEGDDLETLRSRNPNEKFGTANAVGVIQMYPACITYKCYKKNVKTVSHLQQQDTCHLCCAGYENGNIY